MTWLQRRLMAQAARSGPTYGVGAWTAHNAARTVSCSLGRIGTHIANRAATADVIGWADMSRTAPVPIIVLEGDSHRIAYGDITR